MQTMPLPIVNWSALFWKINWIDACPTFLICSPLCFASYSSLIQRWYTLWKKGKASEVLSFSAVNYTTASSCQTWQHSKTVIFSEVELGWLKCSTERRGEDHWIRPTNLLWLGFAIYIVTAQMYTIEFQIFCTFKALSHSQETNESWGNYWAKCFHWPALIQMCLFAFIFPVCIYNICFSRFVSTLLKCENF